MPRRIHWSRVAGTALVAVAAGLLCHFPAAAEDKPPKEPAAKPAPEGQPGAREALVIKDCRLSAAQKQDVPALQSGQLLVIGTELGDSEKVAADAEITIEYSAGGKLRYRRLAEGDRVKAGQLVAVVDRGVALEMLAVQRARVDVAKAEAEGALKTRDEAEQRYRTVERILSKTGPCMSLAEVRAAKLTWDRYFFEEISKRSALTAARAEMSQAEAKLKTYEVRSKIPGVITKVHKQPGEAVKKLDTVLQVQHLDRLRAQGRVPERQVHRLRKGLEVAVKPTEGAEPGSPLKGHVTYIEPLVEGGSVRFWVELANPGGRLLPGSDVTIVVQPLTEGGAEPKKESP